MAGVIRWGGQKYIQWSATLGPPPVGHVPLTREQFRVLEAKIAQLGTTVKRPPVLPPEEPMVFKSKFPPPKRAKPGVRKTVLGDDGVYRMPPLASGGRVAGATELPIVVPLGNSYTGYEGINEFMSDFYADYPEGLPDDVRNLSRRHMEAFANSTIARHQQDLLRREEMDKELRRIEAQLKYAPEGSLDAKALRVQRGKLYRDRSVLNSKIQGNRGQLYDLSLWEHRTSPEGTQYTLDAVDHNVRSRMQALFDSDPKLAEAMTAFDKEIIDQRRAFSTSERFFHLRAAEVKGGARMGSRGPNANVMVDIDRLGVYTYANAPKDVVRDAEGNIVSITESTIGKRVKSATGEGFLGVFARDRNIVPEPLLGSLRHQVISREPFTAGGETRAELKHIGRSLKRIDSYSDLEDPMEEALEVLSEQSSRISRNLSQEMRATAESIGGGIITPEMERAMRKAESYYLGTLYDAPAAQRKVVKQARKRDAAGKFMRDTEGRTIWEDVISFEDNPSGFSIDEPSTTVKESLRTLLLNPETEEDKLVRSLMLGISPELRDELEKRGKYIAKADLPGLLSPSAEAIDIPGLKGAFGDKTGLHTVIGEELQARSIVKSARRKISTTLGRTTEDGAEYLVTDAIDARNFTGLDEMRAVEDATDSVKELRKRGMAISESVGNVIAESIAQSVDRAGLAGDQIPAHVSRAMEIANELNTRQMMLLSAGLTPEELATVPGLSDLDKAAFREMDVHAAQLRRLRGVELSEDSMQLARDALRIRMLSQDEKNEMRAARVAGTLYEQRKQAIYRATVPRAEQGYVAELVQEILATQGTDGLLPDNPFMNISAPEAFFNLSELKRDNAVLQLSGEGFSSQVSLSHLKPAGPGGVDDVSELILTYNLHGDRQTKLRTLMNSGYTEASANELLNQGGPTRFRQRYKYMQFSEAPGLELGIGQEAAPAYERAYRAGLVKKGLSDDVINERVVDEMARFRSSSDAEVDNMLKRIHSMGAYIPQGNTDFILDAHSEGFLSRIMESVDEVNTATRRRADYAGSLISRIFNLKTNLGEYGRPMHADQSLFRVATGEDGVERIMLNEMFEPRTSAGRTEMSSAARSVIDEITEKLGGVDEMKKLIEASSVGRIENVPLTDLGDVFGAMKGGTDAYFSPDRGLYGPLASGNDLRIPFDASKKVRNRLRRVLGMDVRSDYAHRTTLGEAVAKAIDVAENPHLARGQAASDIIDTQIVKPVQAHAAALGNESISQWFTDVQANKLGIERSRKIVQEAAGTVDHIALSEMRQVRFGAEEVKNIFSKRPTQIGAAVVGGLALWGIYRNHKRKKDHTEQDMAGPPHLPGGSAYENSPEGFTSDNRPSFAEQSGGVTYHVDAHGQFDPNAMAQMMSSLVGGSTQLSIQHRPDPIRARNQQMEDMINGY